MAVSKTASGSKIRKWLERLVDILEVENKMESLVFCHQNRTVIWSQEIDTEFHSLLETVQGTRPDLLKPNINICATYSVFLSLHRGWTTRTKELNIPNNVVNLHNHWRSRENKHYAGSFNNMRELYIDPMLTWKHRLQFTRNLWTPFNEV